MSALKDAVVKSLAFWESVLDNPDRHVEESYQHNLEMNNKRREAIILQASERVEHLRKAIKEGE